MSGLIGWAWSVAVLITGYLWGSGSAWAWATGAYALGLLWLAWWENQEP